MKKTSYIMGVILFSFFALFAQAQTDTVQKPVQDPANTWDPKKNPTVTDITSKYEGKMIVTKTALTTQDIFPVLGAYESTTNADAPSVTVALDAQNKGLVWIEGLPQGKIKAMLRKSPAIYKIPAQKTENGKDVAEGTLIYDKDTKTLSIVIGKTYNAEDPSAAFAAPAIGSADEATANADVKTKTTSTKTKTKTTKIKKPEAPKAWTYIGTKVVKETAMTQ
jgi:hypothetical protein